MKKITLFFSLLAMMIVGLQARAAEPTEFTIVGSSTALFGTTWDLNNYANNMVQIDDNTYKLEKKGVELTGNVEYKVVGDHDYGVFEYPMGMNNNNTISIDKSGEYNVTFTLKLEGPELSAEVELIKEEVIEHNYTVAGAAALMGVDWDPAATQNDMTLQEDGTYKLVKENVELLIKDYEYKVVVDHAWGESYPAQNAKVSINKAGKYNVTFTFNAESHEVNALVELVEPTNITSYTVVGDEALMGANWDVTTDAGNDMTKQEDGTYTLVKNEVELEAKEYKYKVVGNHDYSVFQLPLSGDQNLAIAEAGKYNVTFTLTLGEENVLTAEVVKIEEPQPETKYLLHYGTTSEGAVWQDAEFVKGEDGKFVAANIEFAENTEFKVNYGDVWYGGATDDDYYLIHSELFENIALDSNGKNFHINEAGTYTFVLDETEEGIKLTVTGWPEPAHAVYLIGDAPLGGWDPAAPVAMTEANGIYTYTANFEEAKDIYFVFTEGIGSWEAINGHRYGPTEGNEDVVVGEVTTTQLSANDQAAYKLAAEVGEYTFTFDLANLNFKVEKVNAGVVGDLDGDGKADVSDVNIMVNMILGKQAKTADADLDGDNEVDVSDVNILVNIILGKGNTTVEE